ncbi:hypothetical protein LguiB_009667 [Lonicera macranthoides]
MVGVKHAYTSLKKWSELYGNFYKPSKFLEERATKGIPLPSPEASVITFISARVSDLTLASGVPPSRVRSIPVLVSEVATWLW